MNPVVYRQDVISALEEAGDEIRHYITLKTGEVFFVTDEYLVIVDQEDDSSKYSD